MTYGVFDRIVCGVDGTPESLEAVRQAARLAPDSAAVYLLHAVDLVPTAAVAWMAPEIGPAMVADAAEALEEASALVPRAYTSSAEGSPGTCLLDEIERVVATLVAVGTHGTSRAEGILLGATASRMLHDASCSVLVARAPEGGSTFAPQRILVGIDGSDESAAAAHAGLALAERVGASAKGLIAVGGHDVDVDEGRGFMADTVLDDGSPVDVLVAASQDSDLVVIGSRGLHGLRSLGSVSERVAHRAHCSVLVVRGRS